MTGMTSLLLFAAWTLALMFIYVGYRVALVLTFKKPANSWTRGTTPPDPAFITRASHAHLNCVENLPIYAVIVLAATAMGKTDVVNQLACAFLLARIAQSTVHLISANAMAVFIRANLFVVQVGLMAWMLWSLLN